MPITDEDMVTFMAAAVVLTLIKGPQSARELYDFAGYNHEHEPTIHCPSDCRRTDGMLVWVSAVAEGRLIGDGHDDGVTLWRPYREDEPYVMVGQTRHTPRSAVFARADADQVAAELDAMTDEDWAEAEREVERIKVEIAEWDMEQSE